MSVYGPIENQVNTGNLAFTGFSPTLGGDTGNTDAQVPATSGNVKFTGITQNDEIISSFLKRGPNRVFQRLLKTLVGSATGGTATETRARVQASQALTNPSALGGLVTIETQNLISRVTTAADVAAIGVVLDRKVFPSTYVADASGNGGGGHVGF